MIQISSIYKLFFSFFISLYLAQTYGYIPNIQFSLIFLVLTLVSFYFKQHILTGILLAFLSLSLFTPNLINLKAITNCHLDITIIDKGKYSFNAIAKTLACKDEKRYLQGIRINHNELRIDSIDIGDRFYIKANLSPLSLRSNQYDFNYQKYLYSKRIFYKASQISILERKPKTLFYKIKQNLKNKIKQNLNQTQAGFIIALLTGDRSELTWQFKEQLKKTGTSHLIAISGLHLGIISFWAWLIAQAITALISRKKIDAPIKAGAIAALITMTLYLFLVGFKIPIVRSWLMLFIIGSAWFFYYRYFKYALVIAAFVILFIWPFSLFQASFYFSFLATSIVLFYSKKKINFFLKVILIQASITITLLPATWHQFGILLPFSIIPNLIVIPWLSIYLLPSAVLTSITSFIAPSLSAFVFGLLAKIVDIFLQNIHFFASLNLDINITFRPNLITTTISTLLILLFFYYQKKHLLIGAAIILFIAKPTEPSLVLADSRMTSLLVHNKKQAIILDPGYRYNQINHANKWINYLQQHNLELKAIYLSEDKLTRISASSSLLKLYPNTNIIRLTHFDFPHQTQYCQSTELDKVSFITNNNNSNQCELTIKINYINIKFQNKTDNIGNNLSKNSQLFLDQKNYDAKQLGMITLSFKNNQLNLDFSKEKKALWQYKQKDNTQ